MGICCFIEVAVAQHGEGHTEGAPDVVRHGSLLAPWPATLLLHLQGFQEVFYSLSVKTAAYGNEGS